MTERQKTGIWFIITGGLLLSTWIFTFPIVNWAIETGFTTFATLDNFSDEQKYVIGGAGTAALQLSSLLGIPFIITGLAQFILGKQKAKKSSKK